MKFSINATDFRDVLKAACEVAPSKGIIPEYSCLFIQARQDALQIFARDESIDISIATSCDVQEEGEALVPSRMLLDYVSLADGSVTVSVDAKQRMTIKSGKKASSLACMDTSRFKPLAFDGNPVVAAPGSAFASCIARTAFACSADESRAVLCGVHLDISPGGSIHFLSCDGIKSARCDMDKTDFLADWSEPRGITIPSAAIKLIQSQFGAADRVTLSLEPYRAAFSTPEKCLAFPLITKEYPDLSRIFPKTFAADIRLAARPFLEALRLVEIAASSAPSNDNRWNLMRMQTDGENGCVHLSADTESTEASTAVDCDVRGQDMELFFNVRYVRDLATVCAKESDTLVFSLSGPLGIACMQPTDCPAAMSTFITPVRAR